MSFGAELQRMKPQVENRADGGALHPTRDCACKGINAEFRMSNMQSAVVSWRLMTQRKRAVSVSRPSHEQAPYRRGLNRGSLPYRWGRVNDISKLPVATFPGARSEWARRTAPVFDPLVEK